MIKELRYEIRAFMRERRVNANKLAQAAGIDPALLYRFLKGERNNLTLETVEKIKVAMASK